MTKLNHSINHKTKQKSGLAIASLVLGIVSFIPLIGVVLGIIALILGIFGLKNINRDQLGGKQLAIAGIILGILGVIFTFVIYGSLFYFSFVLKSGPFAEVRIKASQQILTQNAGYLELYKKKHGKYPTSLEELTKEEYTVFPVDHFMNPLYYHASSDGSTYELRSAGPDGINGNTDDVILP